MTLAHAQYSAWHRGMVPARLFYELSPELLLFRDSLKLLRADPLSDDACIEGEEAGGVFLDLPSGRGGVAGVQSESVCEASRWSDTCKQLTLSILQKGARSYWGRALSCIDADHGSADIAASAVAPNATYAAFVGALTSSCPGAGRKVMRIAECVVGHTDEVHRAVQSIGCNSLIQQALSRLGKLSHVLFMDATKFSLGHVVELASKEKLSTEASIYSSQHLPRINAATTTVPFNLDEILPHNQYSMQFCALSAQS